MPKQSGAAGDASNADIAPCKESGVAETRAQTIRYAIALAGQTAACLLNPWTWRGAILPVQTLLFLRAGEIGSIPFSESRHPWAIIGEFDKVTGPWKVAEIQALIALGVLIGLAGAGALACLVRRRWGHLALLAGMTAVAFSMSRNMAPGAIVLTPVACGALSGWPGGWLARRRPGAMRKLRLGASAGVLLLAALTTARVVSQKFYMSEYLPWRFGWGPSRVTIPLGAAEFLSRTRPAGRLWTDYNTSSNFYYFTRPHPDVPALTNTWAYPPAVMGEVLEYTLALRPFEEARRKYGVEAVAFRVAGFPRFARELAGDPNWRLTYLDPMYAVFLRADGPNGDLARRLEISPRTFDANRLLREAREWDPVPSYPMHMAAATVYGLGWTDQAIDLFRASLAENDSSFRSWEMLGKCLAQRGQERLLTVNGLREAQRYGDADEADKSGRDDWRKALEAFEKAHKLQPDSLTGIQGLANIRRQIAALEVQHVIVQIQFPP